MHQLPSVDREVGLSLSSGYRLNVKLNLVSSTGQLDAKSFSTLTTGVSNS